MKKVYSLLMMIAMMFAAVNFTSCSGGDDEGTANSGNGQNTTYNNGGSGNNNGGSGNNNEGSGNNNGGGGNNNRNEVVGTWKGYSCTDSDPNNLSKNHSLTLVFNSDGSGNYLEKDNSYTDKCNFTYYMDSSTKGKAFIETRGGNIYFVIEGNKMYVYGQGYGNDLDFLLNKQ